MDGLLSQHLSKRPSSMTTLNQPSRFPTDRGKSAVALVASGALDNPIFVGTEHRLVSSTSKEGAFYVNRHSTVAPAPIATYRPTKVCKHRIALKLQSCSIRLKPKTTSGSRSWRDAELHVQPVWGADAAASVDSK